jgi:hypothetical protein
MAVSIRRRAEKDHGRTYRMLRRLVVVAFLVITAGMAFGADQPQSTLSGIFLTTRYPALTVRSGETTTIDLSVHNYKLPPQQLTLSVPDIASGW